MNNKQPNQATSGASIQKMNQQNAQFGTEFSTETDVQQVKDLNAKAEANKSLASGKYKTP
ncbi:gamma-type small acid-soluble spore protein [Ectobacillus polymachus]|uniref:gamma-type small acid-soluble spore protein n=1 Tax=Ectobacillus polymachus TaxID=1508806 RepID=UPI003A8C28C3